ncbi:MAG: tryptophan synthase subunit alpha [Candidatus Omnitrophica bacterium]|nr:tryptophan synthase subunit alpha [Candidatus Omnitrophota bacterium]
MNRIDKKFTELKKRGKKAFIAYITAGDPSLKMTGKIVLALERSGVDIVELGIPFSDPVADGPTIQAASQRSLARGATLSKIFATVRTLRRASAIPVVFMTYYNPILQFGPAAFFKRCRETGVDGVIIPDLPLEESGETVALSKKAGVAVIFLIAPTSPRSRIKAIASRSRGFIYYVSLTGVTGARKELPPEVLKNVRLVKSVTAKPVAVGFGISDAKQAAMIAKVADGVIVGSALVKIIAQKKDVILKISSAARSLAKAIHNVRKAGR